MGDVAADPVLFSSRVLGRDPFEHTHGALRASTRHVILKGGRRSAKTCTAQTRALWRMFTNRGAKVLVTGPNGDNVKRFVAETSDLLHGSDLSKGSLTDIEGMRLGLANGSEMVGLPPTGGQLRGWGAGVLMVIIDEAGHTAPSVVRDVRYTLLDMAAEGSQLWMIGSPWAGTDHPFNVEHRRGEDGDPDYHVERWATSMNPLLPREELERMRARLDPIEAMSELDGLDVAGDLQFFTREHHLMPCVADFEVPAPADLVGPMRPVIGFDWGVSRDFCSQAVLARVVPVEPRDDGRPTFALLSYASPLGALMGGVVDEWSSLPVAPYVRYWVSEPNGVGAMPSQELYRKVRRRVPVGPVGWQIEHTTAARKLAGCSLLRWLMDRRQIVLPRDPDLLRQFAGMRLDSSGHGTPSLQAEDPAVHDDRVDSAWMTTMPMSRGNRIVCELAPLADPEFAYADPPLEPLTEPIIETGDGLRLYRRLPLMSVRGGRELSVPGEARADGDDRPAGWDMMLAGGGAGPSRKVRGR